MFKLWKNQQRFFVLEEGMMSWWESKQSQSAGSVSTRKGWIALNVTKCEVVVVAGSDTKFVLKPVSGDWCDWQFTGSKQERTFDFDCAGTEHDRAKWMEAMAEHSNYRPAASGTAQAAGKEATEVKPVEDPREPPAPAHVSQPEGLEPPKKSPAPAHVSEPEGLPIGATVGELPARMETPAANDPTPPPAAPFAPPPRAAEPTSSSQLVVDLGGFDRVVGRLEAAATRLGASAEASRGVGPGAASATQTAPYSVDLSALESLVAKLERTAERLEKGGA